MAQNYQILYPANATRIMREAVDELLLAGGTPWLSRTDVVDVTGEEMTLEYTNRVFAADIITADAKAYVRESGSFKASTFGTNKLKHGYAFTESQIALLDRISSRSFVGDNEIISFEGQMKTAWTRLLKGINQRVETMINTVFLPGNAFEYDRLGLKIEGGFGLQSVNATTAATSHDQTSSTPLSDIVTFLTYLDIHWAKRMDRLTCRKAWIDAVVLTDEYKAEVSRTLLPYRDITGVVALHSLNYATNIQNVGGILSKLLGWDLEVEVNENIYYEYQNDGSEGAAVKYHPENQLFFSNKSAKAFDVGDGPLVEAKLAAMAPGSIIGTFEGAGEHGPMGYTTLKDSQLNPAGIVTWATAWEAPRLHDRRGVASMQWK